MLNTVVLQTRERVHDLGVFKAIGMTPRQTTAMVVCSVAGIGLVAGLIAIPAGVALHRYVLPVMAHAAQTGVQASVRNVYLPGELALLALSGLVIAVAGRSPRRAGRPGPGPPSPCAPSRTPRSPGGPSDTQRRRRAGSQRPRTVSALRPEEGGKRPSHHLHPRHTGYPHRTRRIGSWGSHAIRQESAVVATRIFVNLPVKDLPARSTELFP